MNSFIRLWSKKRIMRKGRLTGCMVLIALVTIPLVAALIFSESMMNGIVEKFIYVSDGHYQVTGSTYLNIYDDNIYSIDKTVSGYILIYSNTGTETLQLKGVEDSYFNAKRLKNISLSSDSNVSKQNGIIISQSTAERLSLSTGDKVALLTVSDSSNGFLRPVLLQVKGLYSTGYEQIDSNLAFADYSLVSGLFTETSEKIEILTNNSELLKFIETDGYVSHWQNKNQSIYLNFVNSRQMIFLILLIIVVIASFFTASIANQVIEDDMREIAVSKLLGASDRAVRLSAFVSIYTITALGIIIGLIFGLIAGCNLSSFLTFLSEKKIISLSYYLLDFDSFIPWKSIFQLLFYMMFVSAISISISLRKTKKIKPLRLFNGI